VGNKSPILENLLEILLNPSPISRFPSPEIQFSSHKIQFSPIGFLLSLTAFCFLQRLFALFNGFPLSSTAFRFLQRLSNFPQWLSTFQEIWENLSMVASIQKIAIQASYFSQKRDILQ
jgi:hypothetical protein